MLSFSKKKSLGQHFLHDQKVLKSIVDFIDPKFTDNIIEIGPGAGALTKLLLPNLAALNVIEFDKEVIPYLKNNCKNSEKLHICLGDVLKIDFNQFSSKFKLVGNLPYNISTPILFKAIKNISLIESMHFMLQKEVAQRITASPGSKIYGRLSVMLQYYFEASILLYIDPDSFSPPPKVDSAFIRLIPIKSRQLIVQSEQLLSEIVCAAFCQRRKTIANSLKKYITSEQLREIAIDPIARPEQLSLDQFILISNKSDKSNKNN